ncbi:Ig-like domain-containing protein [Zoogloea sp.]|uniref:Ig-like domain-containing protein n=1 Tax=Zoogloea sp. TaxID=49181 RepID=UPI002634A353|nr:Ig-like domain-containing protein [Zoogloea sp.]MDD3352109.1 Ig-like domain-containing protein [Zoogloea sp.]
MELHTNGNALRFIPTGGAYIDTGAVLSTDEWIHIAASYDASADSARIYINGVQVSTRDNHPDNVNPDDALKSTLSPYYLGKRGDGSYPLNGAIAEYRIWNDVRTAAEIRDNLNASLLGSEANLVALWKLDEATGTTLADSTANNFHGTLNNGTWTTRAVSGGLNVTYTEDAAPVGVFSGVVVDTVESGQTLTALTLTVTNVSDTTESLSINNVTVPLTTATSELALGTVSGENAGSVTVTGAGSTKTVTITGAALSEANLQTLINGITYSNSSQAPGTATPRAVTLTSLTDSGGATASLSLASTVTLAALNDAPVNTVPTAQIALQDGTLVFSPANGNPISITDVDAGTASVTLTATNGTLSLSGTSGLTFTTGDGTADSTTSFSGSLSDINGALAGMSFSPTSGFTGAASLQITTSDGGLTGSGGVQTDTDTIAITVDAAPTVSSVAVPANGTYRTGQHLDFTVNFTEAVTVTGTPRIALAVGSTAAYASYQSGSGTSALLFRYTVVSDNLDTDGITVGALGLNGGTLKDAADNNAVLTLNSVGATGSVRVDAVAPPAPGTPALSDASDSGFSSTDDITNDATPTFTGTAEASSTVTVISSVAGILGTATADGSGNWSHTVGADLSAGHHEITATATDAAGNTSVASSVLSISINTSLPSVTAGATTPFTEQTPVAAAPTLTVTDAGGDADWNGGTLKVQITGNAEAADSLSLPGSDPGGSSLWLDGTALKAGSTAIGSADAASVSAGAAWTFTFNTNATNALVQGLTRAITFNNTSDTPSTGPRSVSFTATDNAGNSGSAVQTVSITAVNDAPTLSGVPGTAQGVTAGTAAALADFTVADRDTGILTVTLKPSNGTLGGLTDADASTPGIQLTGTAAAINTALAGATFTAAGAGAASIAIRLTDGLIATPVTATYGLTAAPAPSPGPAPTPAPEPAPTPAPEPVPTPVPTPTPTPVPEPTPVPGIPPRDEWASLPDDDGDGLPEAVEDFVPAPSVPGAVTGDGNGDGIKDSVQVSVASTPVLQTPTAVSNPGSAPDVFVTLVADAQNGREDTSDTNTATVRSVTQLDAPSSQPATMSMPLGLLNFVAEVQNPSELETFSLYLDPALGVNGYWMQNASGTWVNLASPVHGGQMVIEGGRLRIDFQLQDGGEFDADGVADGVITAPGTVAFMPLSIVGTQPDTGENDFWF